MTDCRNCRRDTDTFLCQLCATELGDVLAELPWLLRQLDITVTRQDKLNLGVVGRSPNASPSPINIGAMELARNLHGQLGTTVRDLCEARGLMCPQLEHAAEMAGWLHRHVQVITLSAEAGQIMRETLGARDALLRAINRNLRMYVGPCTTVTAHNRRGEAIECGHDLYGQRDCDDRIQCPRCKAWVEPREHLLATIHRRDLLPEPYLLETLETLGEPVSRTRLYDWISTGRLRPRGWVHHGRVVPRQVHRGDPRVFSLRQARDLRLAEMQAS